MAENKNRKSSRPASKSQAQVIRTARNKLNRAKRAARHAADPQRQIRQSERDAVSLARRKNARECRRAKKAA